jgi:hypothetical protein
MKTAAEWLKPHDGIISYLTRKHGGNVHARGIVELTSKSLAERHTGRVSGIETVADLTVQRGFLSQDTPGQWFYWNFRNMRVLVTKYTMRSFQVKSWVLEGSEDGERWTELDRQTDNQDFKVPYSNIVSFVVSNPGKVRLMRLTQTDKRHTGDDKLNLGFIEFFGTLYE